MAAFEVIALDTATPQLRAPGASDTYTFPRAVEMPLGTANSVLFLNGSKVVSSGSALTFDGTNLGIGTSSPSFSFDQRGDSGVQMSNAANSNALRFVPGSGVYNINMAGSTHELVFADINGAVELMRLTPTGLGIGTNNPAGYGNTGRMVVQTASSTDGIVATFANSGSTGAAIQLFQNGINTSTIGMPAGVGGITFAIGPTERMRLDFSGNLGLGVTPSAWVFNRRVLEIGGGAAALAFNGSAAISEVFVNSIRDSGGAYRYFANGAASYVDFNNSSAGGWSWAIAPSGTAGNAISFTQAMVLDASGRLGIGTTSPATRLDVTGAENALQARFGGVAGRGLEISTRVKFSTTDSGSVLNAKGAGTGTLILQTESVDRLEIKNTGQTRFIPLAADPTGAENGDVYYNSGTNKLRLYAAGAWVDLN